MAHGLQTVLRHLRRIVTPAAADCSDRRLLEEFACEGRQEAFAALVRRHGPLVLGVCYRVLHHTQDAEDAFQATFLVLARKARSVAWHDSIGNWLHGVAYRIALKARTQGARRKVLEKQAETRKPSTSADPDRWQELRHVLDEELARLPAKYRAPLLLCYLEGKTRDEAATELGWSANSVKGRLERARDLLRSRLARRGLPLSAVLCAMALAEKGASAAVPQSLSVATVQWALAFTTNQLTGGMISTPVLSLTQGVLQAMLWTKVKIATATLLVVAVCGLGTGIAVHQVQAARSPGVDGAASTDLPVLVAQEKKDQPRKPVEGERDPKGRDKKDANEIPAQIKSLDLQKGTLTVLLRGDGQRRGDHSYNLASKDIKVEVTDGPPAKLADLSAGVIVFLKLSADEDVISIRAMLPTLVGTVGEVDAAKSTLSLRAERGEGTSLKVAPDVKVTVDGKAAKLADVAAGQRVNLTLTLNRSTILALQAGKGGDEVGRRPAPKEGGDVVRRKGISTSVIVGVDAAKNTIDVLVGADENLAIVSYTLTKEVKITAGERAVVEYKLADLLKATRVVLKTSDDKKTVTEIVVIPPMIRGTLKSVDAAKNTITLDSREDAKALEVAKDVKIFVQRKDGTLADLAPGMNIQVTLSLDRSRVVSILAFAREQEE